MTDENVLKYFENKKIKYNLIPDNYKNYLLNRCNDLSSIDEKLKLKESLYRLQHKEENFYCPICGRPKKFRYQSLGYYKTCCSKECNRKHQIITFSKNHNGLINVFQLPETIKKIELTKELKYGNSKYNNRPKFKETSLTRYGVSNPNKLEYIKDKIKETNNKKYGCSCTLLNNEIKEKTKRTCLLKYGNETYQSSDNFKEKIKTAIKNKTDDDWKNINNKRKNSIIKKYGVSSHMQIPEVKNKFNWKEIIKKQIETKQKNGTFNKSKEEDKSYLLLKEEYPDVVRQYKSKEYPFNCDFYIPSIDTYIECNYFWTHGFKPYSGSDEDVEQVNEWKEHNTKFYNNAITNWTIRDVEKRNVAKENNLNYLEFFSIFELKNWLNKYDRK